MELFLSAAGAGIAIIILLLILSRLAPAFRRGSGPDKAQVGRPDDGKRQAQGKPGVMGPKPRSCPLCATSLSPGERVKSDIGPGSGDRLMRIFGCPHCWPSQASIAQGKAFAARVCPVCGQTLDPDDHVVARYFEKPGRKHVHVLGCTRCRPKAKGV